MTNDAFKILMSTLDRLDSLRIAYTLRRVREGALMIEVAAPGERWEIEILGDASVQIEVFRSDGTIFSEQQIDELMQCYADRLK